MESEDGCWLFKGRMSAVQTSLAVGLDGGGPLRDCTLQSDSVVLFRRGYLDP